MGTNAVHTWSSLEEQIDGLVRVTLPLLDAKQEYVAITTSSLEGNDWSSSVRLLAFDPSTGFIDHLHAIRLPTTAGTLTWDDNLGLLVAGGDDGDLYFLTFDCAEMKWKMIQPSQTCGHDDLITKVDVGASSLASGSWDMSVKLWSLDSMRLVEQLEGHRDKVWAVEWNPHSPFNLLASSSQDCTVHIWDVRQENTLVSHELMVPFGALSLGWHPIDSNQITTGLEDGSIYTFDIRHTDSPLFIYENHHQGGVHGIVYHNENGSLATYSDDTTIRLYTSNEPTVVRSTYNMHHDYISGMTWHNDWIVSTSYDKSLHYWNTLL